jgi:hypothetical protein
MQSSGRPRRENEKSYLDPVIARSTCDEARLSPADRELEAIFVRSGGG